MEENSPNNESSPQADAWRERAASPVDSSAPVASKPMFDKPNLQLSDPDPYAFANRIRKLILLASVMAFLASIPFLSYMISYQIRRGQMEAEVEIATVALGDLAPSLSGFEQASRLVSQRVSPSVVSIYRPSTRRRHPKEMNDKSHAEGQGSGFIVDSAGYILTNEHVVRGVSEVIVQFNDGENAIGKVIGTDWQTDLALIKTEGVKLPQATWGNSDKLEPGNLVWALGSPFGLERSITFGIVSAKARRSTAMRTINNSQSAYQEYLQTDAAVNPGNSGGPLVNLAGEVIGVNTAIVGDAYQGVSFAIPSNIAQEMYLKLREKGFVERGYLGISPVKPKEWQRKRLQLSLNQGVYVQSVMPNSPAERAGLKIGDMILSWNGILATDPTLLSRDIAHTKIGSIATIVVRREINDAPADKTLKVTVQKNRHHTPYGR